MPFYFLKKLTRYLVFGDYIIINIFFFLGINFFISPSEIHVIEPDYKTQLLILNFSWYIISKLVNLYEDNYYKDEAQDYFTLRSEIFSEMSIKVIKHSVLGHVISKFHKNIHPSLIHNFKIFRRKAWVLLLQPLCLKAQMLLLAMWVIRAHIFLGTAFYLR